MSSGKGRVDPTPGDWFHLAKKAIEAIDHIAAAAERIADVSEKWYNLEREKML